MIPYFEKENNAKVAILRAEKAREVLPEALKKLGHQVDIIPLYHTDLEESLNPEVLDYLKHENRKNGYIFAYISSFYDNPIYLYDFSRAINISLLCYTMSVIECSYTGL